jgi:hypothetical protein
MIKHIVMWKFDASYQISEKEGIINDLKNKLLQLRDKINVLNALDVHVNSANANKSNFDVVLETSFDTWEDLKTYAVHPDHMVVVGFLQALKKERACIDYEI